MTGVAVNVTEVPAHIVVELAEILMLAVVGVVTVATVAVRPLTQSGSLISQSKKEP